jgi:transcriptional regulator with GAF, ATPase, and Fis domain
MNAFVTPVPMHRDAPVTIMVFGFMCIPLLPFLCSRQSHVELQRGGHTFEEEIVGQSPAFQSILNQVRIVAKTDSVTLIQGETGTGKEVIARAIHNQSSRSQGPFVKLNCAAIPGPLLESELFGHERGAFTGACTQTTGRFQQADKGTLFLE